MKYIQYTNYDQVEYGDRQGDYARALGYVDNDGVLHIFDLWVDESIRGQGIATKLIKFFQKKSGAKIVRAENILNSAKDFWKKQGIEGSYFNA